MVRRNSAPAVREAQGKYRVEAVSRAVRLLERLANRSGPVPLAVLAAEAGLSPSLTRSTLETLAHHQLISRTEGGEEAYGLGLAWLRLADIKRRQLDIRELALPVMRRMRDAVDETVILALKIGKRRVNIDYVESTQEVRRVTQPGYDVPLHVGASGRALMSGLDQSELDEYLSELGTRLDTASGPIGRERLLAEIDHVRKQGYAIVAGEIMTDSAAVSAPVHSHAGDVVAALTISFPQDRLSSRLEAACIRQVRRGAGELSALLGWEPERRAR